MKILLSIGHGGIDSGAIASDGRTEHKMAAELGNLIAKYILNNGHEVSCQQESYSANNFRVNSRRGYDIAVSLHFNAFNKKASGFEVLRGRYTTIADRCLTALDSTLNLPNRGMKKRNDLYVFWNNNFDCLIESCFIDNPSDLAEYEGKKEEVARRLAVALMGEPIKSDKTPTTATEWKEKYSDLINEIKILVKKNDDFRTKIK